MPSIDIIFRTKFEDEGSKAVVADLERIINVAKSLGTPDVSAALLDFAPFEEGAQAISRQIAALEDLGQAFIEAGRSAAATGDLTQAVASADAAKKVLGFANQLKVLEKNYGTLATAEAEEAARQKELASLMGVLEKQTMSLDKATESYITRLNRMTQADLATHFKQVQQETQRVQQSYLQSSEAAQQLALSDKELILANIEYTDGAKGLVKVLQEQEQAFTKAAESALEAGLATRSTEFLKTASTYGSLAKEIGKVTDTQSKLSKATADYAKRAGELGLPNQVQQLSGLQKVLGQVRGGYLQTSDAAKQLAVSDRELILSNLEYSGGAQGLIKVLQAQEAQFRANARAALEAGDAMEASRLTEIANSYQGITNEIKTMSNTGQSTWKSFGDAAKFVLDPLNRVGFGLFLITQNLKTVQMIVGGAFNALLDGAKKADRAINYQLNLQQAGIDARQYKKELDEASQGLITFTSMQDALNTALRDGNQELANSIPLLAKIAVQSAYDKGDVSLAQQYFEALTSGIAKVQPDMLEQVGIFGSAEEAAFLYKLAIDDVGSQSLTTAQKQQALLNLVLNQGDEFLKQTEPLDSYAAGYLDLANNLSEATDAAKIFFGIVGTEAFGALADILGVIDEKLGTNKASLIDISKFFTFYAVVGVTAVNAVKETILDSVESLSKYAEFAEKVLSGENVIDAAKDLARDIQQGIDSGISANPLENFQDNLTEAFANLRVDGPARDLGRKIAAAFGLGIEEGLDEGGSLLDKITDKFEEAYNLVQQTVANVRIDAALDKINSALDGQMSHLADLADAWRDYQKTLSDIDDDLENRLDDLSDRHNERLGDLEQDYLDRLSDINEDINDDIIKAQEDADKKRDEAKKKSNDKREKLERDHQRRIDEILRRADLARLTAIIDRDARALFEAEMRKKEELAKENEKYKDSLEELEKAKQEELEKIKENEDEKIKEINDRAEEQRKDALKNWERQQRDAENAYQRQRRAAEKAAEDRRRDALSSYRDQYDDLWRSYREREMLQGLRESAMTLEQARQLGIRNEDLDRALDEAEERWQQYYDFLGRLGTGTGGGGKIAPGEGGVGGTQPPPSTTPPPPTQTNNWPNCLLGQTHGSCTEEGLAYVCSNGKVWICTGGRWVPQLRQQSSPTQETTAPTMSTMSAPTTLGTTGYRVTLNVQGDSALVDLIERVSTDVFVEVVTS